MCDNLLISSGWRICVVYFCLCRVGFVPFPFRWGFLKHAKQPTPLFGLFLIFMLIVSLVMLHMLKVLSHFRGGVTVSWFFIALLVARLSKYNSVLFTW